MRPRASLKCQERGSRTDILAKMGKTQVSNPVFLSISAKDTKHWSITHLSSDCVAWTVSADAHPGEDGMMRMVLPLCAAASDAPITWKNIPAAHWNSFICIDTVFILDFKQL